MFKQRLKMALLWPESIVIRTQRRLSEIKNTADGLGFFKYQYQKVFCRKSVVYFADTKRLTPLPVKPPTGLSTRRYHSLHELPAHDCEVMRRHSGRLELLHFEEDFRSGDELWVGYFDKEPAGLCWAARRESVGPYFVSLTEDDIVIQKCLVFMAFRNRGVYSFMLHKMVRDFAVEGIERVFIDCKVWNTASCRGISKAGFLELGQAAVSLFGQPSSLVATVRQGPV